MIDEEGLAYIGFCFTVLSVVLLLEYEVCFFVRDFFFACFFFSLLDSDFKSLIAIFVLWVFHVMNFSFVIRLIKVLIFMNVSFTSLPVPPSDSFLYQFISSTVPQSDVFLSVTVHINIFSFSHFLFCFEMRILHLIPLFLLLFRSRSPPPKDLATVGFGLLPSAAAMHKRTAQQCQKKKKRFDLR